MRYEVLQLNGLGMEANSYLVLCQKPVLVDVGTGARQGDLEKRLEAALEGRSLQLIILTHMHFDHTGGAAALQEATGAGAVAHSPDAKALAEGNGDLTCSGWLGERQRPVRLRTVKEGELLDCGEFGLEVLHTPGHTSGSMCLYDRNSGTLFSGDTVFANGGVGRWDLPTGDHSALVRSLQRLSKMKVERLYPGHGPYYEEGGNSHIEMGLEMARDYSL